MHNLSGREQLNSLATDLRSERPLPNRTTIEQLQLTFSHSFREFDEALGFAHSIMLSPGEALIGGHTQDSFGDLWWVGVRIDDKEQWRLQGGFHRTATYDPEAELNEML